MRQSMATRAGLDREREFRAAAQSARLRYVSDTERGFGRRRRGKALTYVRPGGATLRDKATLDRIRSLAIPPAWKDVWICPAANGHLQATGRDARGRKQYRYHPRWREAQEQNKYERIIAFAKTLPKIRRTAARHLRKRGLPREKVLAAAVKLLEATLIRVGNDEYARDNESYGLTTMHDEHVEVRGATIRFDFRGKHGIEHEIDLKDQRLAAIVRGCRDLPGQELFQYLDETGEVRDVGSGDVNDYLREIGGEDFTPRIFARGPARRSPRRHCRNSRTSTRRPRQNGTSPRRSSGLPSGWATRKPSVASATCTRQLSKPTWTARSSKR